MMKINPLLIITLFAFAWPLKAQNILNAKSPLDVRQQEENKDKDDTSDEPIPYGEVQDKDIVWSKIVWEVIDLKERINQAYYFPSDGNVMRRDKSLFTALLDGIKSGEIKEVYGDSAFKNKITLQEIAQRTERLDTSDAGRTLINQGKKKLDAEYIDRYQIDSRYITLIKVMGMWYIDKRLGEMRYRILGVAPMGPDVYQMGGSSDEPKQYVDLFWIWYPDARKTLSINKVLSPTNGSTKLSYDDLLNARRWNGRIYKEENLQGDREIKEFLPNDAQAQIDEADRIKNSILNKENDMWSY